MTTRRRGLTDALLAVVLGATLLLVAGAQAPPSVYLPALGRVGAYPQALHIPADYVLDGVDTLYVDNGLYVAVQTISPTNGHPKVAVVYHEAALGLTPVLTVTAIYGAPSLILTPDGRLLVSGADRSHTLHLVAVPR